MSATPILASSLPRVQGEELLSTSQQGAGVSCSLPPLSTLALPAASKDIPEKSNHAAEPGACTSMVGYKIEWDREKGGDRCSVVGVVVNKDSIREVSVSHNCSNLEEGIRKLPRLCKR